MSNSNSSNNSNLSPARITFRGDRLIATVMIRQGEAWKKFSIACDSPRELWDTLHCIHAKGAQALSEQARGANSRGESTIELSSLSNTIEVDYDYIDEAVKAFLGKGKSITKCNPGQSAFGTSKIDISAMLAELDKIEVELMPTPTAEVPIIESSFDEAKASLITGNLAA